MLPQAIDALPDKLLSLGANFGTVLFSGLFILFCVYSLVLLYHWIRYAPKNLVMVIATVAYFGGGAVFLLGLLGSLSL